jgi:hypothetical protein
LQAYNKQFLIGLGIFLGLSAFIKGLSLVVQIARGYPVEPEMIDVPEPVPEVRVQLPVSIEEIQPFHESEGTPIEPEIDYEEYQRSVVEVSTLSSEISALKNNIQQLESQLTVCDTQAQELSVCTNLLDSSQLNLHECETHGEGQQAHHDELVVSLKSEFVETVRSKNVYIEQLESHMIDLKGEVKLLNQQVAEAEKVFVEQKEAFEHDLMLLQDEISRVKRISEIPIPTDDTSIASPTAESLDTSLLRNASAVFILTTICTILSIVTGLLYLERRKLIEERNRDCQTKATTAGEADEVLEHVRIVYPTQQKGESVVIVHSELVDNFAWQSPEESERIAMSIEDTRASIVRDVTRHLEEIELLHEREISRMRAILAETGDIGREISVMMKGVILDTSMASTANNTPREFDMSSSSDESGIGFSSLSSRLESSLTPIKIETQRPPPSVSPPAFPRECFIIGSPKPQRNLHEIIVGEDSHPTRWDRPVSPTDSSGESSSEMALEQIRGNFA